MAYDQWYTPLDIVETVRRFTPDTLFDPTSHPASPMGQEADLTLTEEDDCLDYNNWPCVTGDYHLAYMNPPYSNVEPFVDVLLKWMAAFHLRTEAVVVTNSSTATAWYQKLLAASSAVILPDHRIRFLCTREHAEEKSMSFDDVEGFPDLVQPRSPRYNNTIFYLGPVPQQFRGFFGKYGQYLEPK